MWLADGRHWADKLKPGEDDMITKGLLVHLDVKHGMDAEVERFLLDAVPAVRSEPRTAAWFALRFGRGEYGILDVFADEAARDAHLNGAVAAALMAKSIELLQETPRIETLEVLASKMPAGVEAARDTKGLLLSFQARSGYEDQVGGFFIDARRYVIDEPGTTAWFAIRRENGDYGIFDVFPDNGARFAHLTGHVPRELAKHALSFLGSMPEMHLPSVLAEIYNTRAA
jgi:quinol monooxygenase YgiN